MIKLVVDGKTNKVLGAHMVSEYIAEIIHSFAVAFKNVVTQ